MLKRPTALSFSVPTPGGFEHQPVLLEETAAMLAGCRRILDGTVGGAGHARRLARDGAVIMGLDQDPAAVAAARAALGAPHVVKQLNFADAADDPDVRAFAPDGALLDLGVSSPQIDETARGFTFREGAPLDMRMSDDGPSAAEWLNREDDATIAAALREGGDEPRAGAIAREIVRRRQRAPLAVSDDLVGAIRKVLGPRSGAPEFARIFQAVRIAVNRELERLARALPDLLGLLAPGGVLAVIAYHSGEDRLTKHAMREWARDCVCPPDQPVCTCRGRALGTLLTRRAVTASEAEIAVNPRARSARLRAFRKAAA
jgi:16S rRNA (cytosine1402-N4)-methyltransferase